MRRIALVCVLAVAGFFTGLSFAKAQEVVPDNRYQGYPKSLVQWPTGVPDLKACEDQEYYEPLDTHLTVYAQRVRIAGVRVQQFDECAWMLTRFKWRWVLRPAGTEVLVDAQDRDLFDGGSPSGKRCENPRPMSFIIQPKEKKVRHEPEADAPFTGPQREQPRRGDRVVLEEAPKKKGGFCSSKGCRIAAAAFVVVGGGYAAWYYWPCPPGTSRR